MLDPFPNKPWRILIVDDITANIKTIHAILGDEHELFFATNGSEAMEIARNSTLDLILLDIVMPGMSGLEVCQELKRDIHTQYIPVVFITCKNDDTDVVKGLENGAYYYLTRPIHRETLMAIAQAAIYHYNNHRTLLERTRAAANTLKLMNQGLFSFKTLEEANDLAVMLACVCKDPTSAVIGLRELLYNAVEHGNLGITYEDKSNLSDPVDWEQEIKRRMLLAEYRDKKVHVTYERTCKELQITIRDEGPGFDWKPFLTFDPERMFDTHGRGIALALGIAFNTVQFMGSGNTVKAIASLEDTPLPMEQIDMV
ncbi:MAG: response regulator [Magnetococcales bacterium]|nr:response regulator [Magnetococcales bacterium]